MCVVKMVSPVECVGVCVNISTVDWSVRNTGFLVYSGKYVCVWGDGGVQQQDLMVLSCCSAPVLRRPHHGDQLDVGVGGQVQQPLTEPLSSV